MRPPASTFSRSPKMVGSRTPSAESTRSLAVNFRQGKDFIDETWTKTCMGVALGDGAARYVAHGSRTAKRQSLRQETKDLLAPKSAIQLICKENKTTRAIAVREGFGRWPRHDSLACIFVHRRPTAIRCRSCFCVMP